jgi:hypothetical protein
MTKAELPKAADPEEDSDGLLLADGFEQAFIGTAYCWQCQEIVAVYDREECIAVLMQRDGMTYAVADEHMQHNVEGSYMGPKTPMFIELNTLTEYLEMRG